MRPGQPAQARTSSPPRAPPPAATSGWWAPPLSGRRREGVVQAKRQARRSGDPDEAILYWGQTAALIDEVVPAGQVIARMVSEAETILHESLPRLVVR